MKVSSEAYKRWSMQLVGYYRNTDPFDSRSLMIDMMRLLQPLRLYRVLYSCAYLGENDIFAGGTLTSDILKNTGWRMPGRATAAQIEKDKVMSEKLEKKCRRYISRKKVMQLIEECGLGLPVEWRMFYVMYVLKAAFTTEELSFIKENPCWMLSLVDNPPWLGTDENIKGEEKE